MPNTSSWFHVERFPHGVTMIAEPHHSENVKSYLVEGERDIAVLDTGMGVGDFAGLIASLSDRDPIVLQSHAHFDHVGASARFKRVLVHPSEADSLRAGMSNEQFRPWLEPQHLRGSGLPREFDIDSAEIKGVAATGELQHGDLIDLGGRELEAFHTPGHSPGGITLLDRADRILFPGDAVYLGPMFAWRPYSDPVVYRDSLRLLAELADACDVVYPSHNQSPMTPEDVRQMHAEYENIWAGRKQPDKREPERDVFEFDGFSFWLRTGAYGDR